MSRLASSIQSWRTNEFFWMMMMDSIHSKLGKPPSRFSSFCAQIRKLPEDAEEFQAHGDGQSLLARGYYPGISAAPIHDKAGFAFAQPLEAAADMIRGEVEAFLERKDQETWSGDFFSGSYGEDYSGIAIARHGSFLAAAAEALPGTVSLLSELGLNGANRLVHIARQAPRSGVGMHSDGIGYLLTGHVGLKVPPRCNMVVQGIEIEWPEGELVVVQNSFPHYTRNGSDSERILLYFDFWHPSLDEEEQQALILFEQARRDFEAEQQQTMMELSAEMPGYPDMSHLASLVERMHTKN